MTEVCCLPPSGIPDGEKQEHGTDVPSDKKLVKENEKTKTNGKDSFLSDHDCPASYGSTANQDEHSAKVEVRELGYCTLCVMMLPSPPSYCHWQY